MNVEVGRLVNRFAAPLSRYRDENL